MGRTQAGTRSAAALQDQWRQRALASVWSGAPQWWPSSSVETVSEVLATGLGSSRSAAEAFGRDRADARVFLDEMRADLLLVTELASLSRSETAGLVDAATLAWIDRTLDRMFAEPCVDPLTELAPLSYLRTRLDEIYADAKFRGRPANERHALVLVRAAPGLHPIERECHLVTIQLAMRSAFPAGETLARVGRLTAVALARRAPDRLDSSLARLGQELDSARRRGRLGDSKLWLEDLPDDLNELGKLLHDLAD